MTALELFLAVSKNGNIDKSQRREALKTLVQVILDDSAPTDWHVENMISLLQQANEDEVDMIPPNKLNSEYADKENIIYGFSVLGYDLEYTNPTAEQPFGVFNIIV